MISEISAILQFVFANMIEKATDVTLFWNLSRNPDKISSKIRRTNAKYEAENEKIRNSIFNREKNVGDFWLKCWDWRTVQRSALCRSRRQLSNEYLLAKIGFDTAEYEPLAVWGKIFNIIHWRPYSRRLNQPRARGRTRVRNKRSRTRRELTALTDRKMVDSTC